MSSGGVAAALSFTGTDSGAEISDTVSVIALGAVLPLGGGGTTLLAAALRGKGGATGDESAGEGNVVPSLSFSFPSTLVLTGVPGRESGRGIPAAAVVSDALREWVRVCESRVRSRGLWIGA